jgi:hypothetical protein
VLGWNWPEGGQLGQISWYCYRCDYCYTLRVFRGLWKAFAACGCCTRALWHKQQQRQRQHSCADSSKHWQQQHRPTLPHRYRQIGELCLGLGLVNDDHGMHRQQGPVQQQEGFLLVVGRLLGVCDTCHQQYCGRCGGVGCCGVGLCSLCMTTGCH